MLTVQEEDYQPEYGESYPSNVHGEPTIEGYQYCVGLKRAFESLMSEQFRSYFNSRIHCADNGHFKVFDLRARDVCGKSHARGTCVLLDISPTDNLYCITFKVYMEQLICMN